MYRFSAGHRLYIKGLSEEDNFKIFDKCSNLNGHGHNYKVGVKVSGEIDKDTQMVIKPEFLDRKVGSILEELDHKRLDVEVPYFRGIQSTGENIAKFFWERLSDISGINLSCICIWENERSYFEYFQEEQR